MALDSIQKALLAEIADLHGVPEGAYNIRSDGQLAGRNTTANIDIVTKQDKPGIDIFIKPGTKNESMHIPVIIAKAGLKEVVPCAARKRAMRRRPSSAPSEKSAPLLPCR